MNPLAVEIWLWVGFVSKLWTATNNNCGWYQQSQMTFLVSKRHSPLGMYLLPTSWSASPSLWWLDFHLTSGTTRILGGESAAYAISSKSCQNSFFSVDYIHVGNVLLQEKLNFIKMKNRNLLLSVVENDVMENQFSINNSFWFITGTFLRQVQSSQTLHNIVQIQDI